ncbi:MAG TPA: hypothetical protein VGB79_15845 [Allosphingosinicella sp.]|jgi:hypothetical protein
MADYSTCTDPACGTTIEGRPAACPKCAAPMRRLRESKIRAFVLMGTGLFLIGFMGWIWSLLWRMLWNPGVEHDGSRFAGTADDAQLVMLLFSAVILFGICGFSYGVYMLATGRESDAAKKVLIGLVTLLVAIGGIIRYGIG